MKALKFRFLDVLSQMTTAIWALGLLALASVVGTFVVQQTSDEVLVARYGFFWAEVFSQLQIDRLYNAWWFLFLAGFLVVSVSTCLVRNGPHLWRQLLVGKSPPNFQILRTWPATHETTLPFDEIAQKLCCAGFTCKKTYSSGESYWIKNKLGRWGYFLTHGAVILLCLGALITGVWGYRLTLHLVEGESYNYAARWQKGAFEVQDLSFSLKNNQTLVEHYFTGMPKQFQTDLTLKSGNGEQRRTQLKVNHPVNFAGHRIYQADYGDGGSQIAMSLRSLKTGKLHEHTYIGRTGFKEDIYPQADTTLIPHKLQPNTVIDVPNKDETAKKPTNIGPSLEIILQTPTSAPTVLKVFENQPWLLGIGQRAANETQIEENITNDFNMYFLGLDPTQEAGWNLVAKLMQNTPPSLQKSSELQAYYSEKLPRVGEDYLKTLPEQQRLRIGLSAIMAATTLQELGLPFVPLLKYSEFKPYSGVIVAYDPGFWPFVVGGILLVLGTFFMIYCPLIRVWVRQFPQKNAILLAAFSTKEASLPVFEKILHHNSETKT